ncbi:shikimate O-hydroxycinnamoyltransferase [Salvia divinorum]|uniref:Shikimate O-hydroxycinnamoyltransferase n=1 Tax=Salvia divinorum TaxID=28513 RepID=A0ABD1FSS0_SALDI
MCLVRRINGSILSNFYPLAGRYNKNKQQVDCNDQGALFATAQVDADLSLILRSHVDPQQLNQLLPVDVSAADNPTDPILSVQISIFQCRGLAIAACAAHRVFDSASFSSFLAAWAKAAETGGKLLTLFRPSLLLPPPRIFRPSMTDLTKKSWPSATSSTAKPYRDSASGSHPIAHCRGWLRSPPS